MRIDTRGWDAPVSTSIRPWLRPTPGGAHYVGGGEQVLGPARRPRTGRARRLDRDPVRRSNRRQHHQAGASWRIQRSGASSDAGGIECDCFAIRKLFTKRTEQVSGGADAIDEHQRHASTAILDGHTQPLTANLYRRRAQMDFAGRLHLNTMPARHALNETTSQRRKPPEPP